MDDLNEFRVSGNLLTDVTEGKTTKGTATAFYCVASKDGQGRVSYIPIKTYGKQAENDAKYLKKGSFVTAKGSIQSWSKPAENKSGFNFVAQTIQYGKRTATEPSTEEPANHQPPSENQPILQETAQSKNVAEQSADEWMADFARTDASMNHPRRS